VSDEAAAGRVKAESLTMGCKVRVMVPSKHAGMLGCVLEITDVGGARIQFDKGIQWIPRAKWDHFEVVESPADEVEVDEAIEMLGALHIGRYSDQYNFNLVTSDISKVAEPGDDGTNARYSELMHEVDKMIHVRPDFSRLNWEVNATRIATDEELLLGGVHTKAFIRAMGQRTSEAKSRGPKKSKHYLKLLDEISAGWSRDTETAARTGVASLIDCAKQVFSGAYAHGFVLARPPSHHAVGNEELARNGSQKNMPFGFCHLNSIASAIANLREEHPKLRVCIFDFDVHPGNGNEDTFWNDASVLTVSIHQYRIWPGLHVGRAEYVGGQNALGSVLNVPILEGADDADYVSAVIKYIIPEIKKFRPDLLFVAAGFDALKGDPYGDQQLTKAWYGWCIAELMRLSIPMVLNLEGGYDPRAVACGIDECITALTGVAPEAFLNRMALDFERDAYEAHCRRMFDARCECLRAAR